MVDPFSLPKKRNEFTLSTRKIEWMKAAGKDPKEYTEKKQFSTTSKCRACGTKLTWGDRRYHFDHYDNNPQNNRQSNCKLLCRNCHGEATKIEKRKVKDPIFGFTVGHKTVKMKVGYKEALKKPKAAKKTAKKGATKKSPFDLF